MSRDFDRRDLDRDRDIDRDRDRHIDRQRDRYGSRFVNDDDLRRSKRSRSPRYADSTSSSNQRRSHSRSRQQLGQVDDRNYHQRSRSPYHQRSRSPHRHRHRPRRRDSPNETSYFDHRSRSRSPNRGSATEVDRHIRQPTRPSIDNRHQTLLSPIHHHNHTTSTTNRNDEQKRSRVSTPTSEDGQLTATPPDAIAPLSTAQSNSFSNNNNNNNNIHPSRLSLVAPTVSNLITSSHQSRSVNISNHDDNQKAHRHNDSMTSQSTRHRQNDERSQQQQQQQQQHQSHSNSHSKPPNSTTELQSKSSKQVHFDSSSKASMRDDDDEIESIHDFTSPIVVVETAEQRAARRAAILSKFATQQQHQQTNNPNTTNQSQSNDDVNADTNCKTINQAENQANNHGLNSSDFVAGKQSSLHSLNQTEPSIPISHSSSSLHFYNSHSDSHSVSSHNRSSNLDLAPDVSTGLESIKSIHHTQDGHDDERQQQHVEVDDGSDFDLFSNSPVVEPIQSTGELNVASDRTSSLAQQLSHDRSSGFGERSHTTSIRPVAHDACDDSEGYYIYRFGDLLCDGRYRVLAQKGQGVFSTVLHVQDVHVKDESNPHAQVVVKVIRSNPVMTKAGQLELQYCRQLSKAAERQNAAIVKSSAHHQRSVSHHNFNCVELLHHFTHRSHLCLVFELLSMDARRLLKKYGSVGLSIQACRSYAKQLIAAIRLMSKCHLLHADIKPDNLLVRQDETILKLADFGSTISLSDAPSLAPYLVSRYYRAPEIMLGCSPLSTAADIWSVGVTIYELLTGKVLFPGSSNNEMLRLQQELCGAVPKAMLRRADQLTAEQHFNLSTGEFAHQINDKLTQSTRLEYRHFAPSIGSRSILDLIRPHCSTLSAPSGSSEATIAAVQAEQKSIRLAAEWLSLTLIMDPNKRATVDQLSKHPFVKEQ